MAKPDYDTSLARMAGNILAGAIPTIIDAIKIQEKAGEELAKSSVILSVSLARAIVAEIKRTEPAREDAPRVNGQ